ncbi:MAG: hypothetical protein MUF51_02060, partial [Vicinamibacteria bacterium]|nr:hypothetical protein [Vicinamibacteria bacterium]
MRTRLMAAALCLLGRLVCAQDAEPPPLALHEYIGELRGIEDAVRAADLDPARARALALAERRVQSGDVVFHADRSLLEPLARAASLKSADAQVARLRRLITALENLQATSAAQAPRPELLNGLLPSDTLQKGGRIARVEIQDLSTLDRVLSLYQQMMDWLRARWRKLRAWLKKFWPQREMRVGETGSVNVSVLITITILTIVLILLAIRTLRRSRSAIPA